MSPWGQNTNSWQGQPKDYCRSNIRWYTVIYSETLSKFPPAETVDITDIISEILYSKYTRMGAVSVLLKNKTYFLKFDIETWVYCSRGVPSLGFGAYRRMSLEDYKKELAKDSSNYNSLDLDSRYDGIGNVYFRKAF
jgi:hypothetical protein